MASIFTNMCIWWGEQGALMVCGSVVFEMDVDKSGKETILFALMNQVNLLQT